MKRALAALALTLSLAAALVLPASDRAGDPPGGDPLAALHSAGIPLMFEENSGQAPDGVSHLMRGGGVTALFEPGQVRLIVSQPSELMDLVRESQRDPQALEALRNFEAPPARELVLRFEGAEQVTTRAGEQLETRLSYFLGDDPSRWRQDVPVYGSVSYDSLYEGIDAVFYGNAGRMEYDFVVAPGADPSQVVLRVDGADSIEQDGSDLVLHAGNADLRMRAPLIYQETGEGRVEVAGAYVVGTDGLVRFQVDRYDRALALVIDPLIEYATYLGGDGSDAAFDVNFDADGDVWMLGITNSTVLEPGGRGFDATTDVFLARFDQDDATGRVGGVSQYIQFGGSNFDVGNVVTVTDDGQVTVGGWTFSQDYPTTANAYQQDPGGASDATLTIFDPNGGLDYASYFGGPSGEIFYGASYRAQDTSTFLTGATGSPEFPAGVDGLGGSDVLNVQFYHSTNVVDVVNRFGGAGEDIGWTILAGPGEDTLTIGGYTESDGLNTEGPALSGQSDGFVARLDDNLGTDWLRNIGGGGLDGVYDLIVNPHPGGDIITVTGWSGSDDLSNCTGGTFDGFPAEDAFFANIRDGESGRDVTHINCFGQINQDEFSPTIVHVDCLTIPGARGDDDCFGFGVGWNDGDANGVYDTHLDFYEGGFESGQAELRQEHHFHGSGGDYINKANVSADGQVAAGGSTDSDDFPVTDDALQGSLDAAPDAVLIVTEKPAEPKGPNVAVFKGDTADPVRNGTEFEYVIDVVNQGPGQANNVVMTDILPNSLEVVSSTPDGLCTGSLECNIGTLAEGESVQIRVRVKPTEAVELLNTATVSADNDSDPSDNIDTETTLVEPAADVAVGIAGGALVPGVDIKWRVFVTNNGPDATNVTASYSIAPGLTITSTDITTGTLTDGSWNIGPMSAGQRETLEVNARVNDEGTFTLSASAAGDLFDPVPQNNSRSNAIPINILFEGYTPRVVHGFGGADRSHVDELIAALDAAIEPDVWNAVSRYEGDTWLSVFRDAPLDSFNTLTALVDGQGYWFFVTQEAFLGVAEPGDPE
jgi:uncharacterized repeat protein (TIGR01451 family)